MKEIHYRIATPVQGGLPGHHRSPRGDGGFEWRGHAPLLDAPDARRLDMLASLRDPFGGWRVRVYNQRKAVPVVVVADLSASMGFAGRQRKADVMADFVATLAESAWRTGDSFGFVGCDAVVREDWLRPPTRARGVGQALAQALRTWAPALPGARSAVALARAHELMGRRRALVFLLSDFHLDLAFLPEVLASLSAHELVPVVLWDASEFDLGPRDGLAQVLDPEGGARRWVWWRAALRARWQRAQQARRAQLLQVFAAHHLKPLFIEQGFDADAVTRHFHT